MITDALKKEIRKFDHERVVPTWDGLVARQQAELAQAHVPTMFVTGEAENLEVSFFKIYLTFRRLKGLPSSDNDKSLGYWKRLWARR